MADEQNTPPAPPPAAPPAAPPPAAPPADGNAEPWYATAGLDDEIRTFVAGKQFPSLADALKAGMHADKIARERNVLDMPNPNDLASWKGWEHIGWTPDATKYDVGLPDKLKDMGDLAEGYKPFHDHLVKTMHANRVPLSAAKALAADIVSFNTAAIAETDAAIAREKQELEGGLRREWGQSYDQNKELAKRAMQTFGIGEADAAELDAVITSPRMVKMFHKLGEMMGEDKLVTAKGAAGTGIEAAKQAKLALESDPAKMAALRDPAHAQHAMIKAERERLQQIIFASAA